MIVHRLAIRFTGMVLTAVLLFYTTGCQKTSPGISPSSSEDAGRPYTDIQSEDQENDIISKENISSDSTSEDEENNSSGSVTLNMEIAGAESILTAPLSLPDNTYTYSPALAMQALTLCTGYTAEQEAALLEMAGFTTLIQNNYDTEDEVPHHTCAYTVGSREITWNGEQRPLLIIAIRGTNGSEWYANFDFAPSQNEETVFAENFLFAAEDVLLGIQQLFPSEESLNAAVLPTAAIQPEQPLILICGYSRGAACANLLGVLLNAVLGNDHVFVYTFATPATIRGDDFMPNCENIFNLINPCDLVTKVPLAEWGYRRPGTDIILPNDMETAERIHQVTDLLTDLSPTISRYYEDRHSLTDSGLSQEGLTTFEMMLLLGRSLINMTETDGAGRQPDMSIITDITDTAERIKDSDSDFAPLFQMFDQTTEDGSSLRSLILAQHMPGTYQALLAGMTGGY